MNLVRCRSVLSGILLFALLSAAWGQETPDDIRSRLEASVGQIVRLRTEGGGEFQGKLLSVGSDRVELEDGEGQILFVSILHIWGVLVIDPTKGRDFYFQDAAENKLILMPVGFGMDPGEFHVADQEIVIVSASYGISPHLSLWGALSIPGALVNVRFSAGIGDRVGLSVGSFAGMIFMDFGTVVALPYVIASFGSENQNLTIGAGVPFFGDLVPDAEEDGVNDLLYTGGIVALGGKIVVSGTASLVTENWVLVLNSRTGGVWSGLDFYFIPAVTFRIAGSRFSWDIGVALPFAYARMFGETAYRLDWITGDPIPIPILGFTYRIE